MFPPPKASFSFSPGPGDATTARPPIDNRRNSTSLAVVPASTSTGTATASPMSGFGGGRPPLTPLGTNNADNSLGFGMRQRRQSKDTPTGFVGHGGFPREVQGPPRWSLSMSMGPSEASGLVSVDPNLNTNEKTKNDSQSLVPQTTEEHWVIVFGMSTNKQYEEILAKFKNFGHVMSIKGVPVVNESRNWVALSYDSPLTVEKAVGESRLQLSDGCLCGVQRLLDVEYFFASQGMFTSVTEQVRGADGRLSQVQRSSGLFPMSDNSTNNNNTPASGGDLKESDILMAHDNNSYRKTKTACEKIMGWVYGW